MLDIYLSLLADLFRGLLLSVSLVSMRYSDGDVVWSYFPYIGRQAFLRTIFVILNSSKQLCRLTLTWCCFVRTNASFYAVYDGHGGDKAARFSAQHLHKYLAGKFPKGLLSTLSLRTNLYVLWFFFSVCDFFDVYLFLYAIHALRYVVCCVYYVRLTWLGDRSGWSPWVGTCFFSRVAQLKNIFGYKWGVSLGFLCADWGNECVRVRGNEQSKWEQLKRRIVRSQWSAHIVSIPWHVINHQDCRRVSKGSGAAAEAVLSGDLQEHGWRFPGRG